MELAPGGWLQFAARMRGMILPSAMLATGSAVAEDGMAKLYAERFAADPRTFVARILEDAQFALEECPELAFEPAVLRQYTEVIGSPTTSLVAINEAIEDVIGRQVYGDFGGEAGGTGDSCMDAVARYGPEGVIARGLLVAAR